MYQLATNKDAQAEETTQDDPSQGSREGSVDQVDNDLPWYCHIVALKGAVGGL